MDENKRVLVISWYFPPVNSSEGLVTWKLINHSKYSYDVYTQRKNNAWAYKQSELECGNNIKRIFSEEDDINRFSEAAYQYYLRHRDEYDVVMTRSMPEADHIAGLRIKAYNPSIKWIASFGDPVAQNPFTLQANRYYNAYSIRNAGRSKALSPKRILRSALYERRYKNSFANNTVKKLESLQRQILENADYVICNNKYEARFLLNVFNIRNANNTFQADDKPLKIGEIPEDSSVAKTCIIPHSFDASLYPEGVEHGDKISFTYVGHLDNIRSPRTIFEALLSMKEHDEALKDKVKFDFYGNVGDEDKLFLMNNELLDIVRIHKHVDYLESLRIMKNSDWLLHIDADISRVIDKNIFFAAKLADYIGTGNKIFGITMIEGAAKDILREYGGLTVEHSASEAANYLYKIIYEGYTVKINREAMVKYDARQVASQFDELLAKM